jgi:ubiquinone/menaquinone biosynthesis C-methylase UbiE
MEHFYQKIGEDWFTYPNLYKKMVGNNNNGSHFVEVGVWKGRSASFMAVEIINSNKNIKFDCVDTWEGSVEHQNYDIISEKKLFDVFSENIEPVSHIINPIRMKSLEAVNLYDDESLDFVFIDASHEYEDVKNDILAWLPKVKEGGFIGGHDYSSSWDGVVRAVDEIFNNSELVIDEYCWLYEKKPKVFKNIDEQRQWNDESMWTDGGHEWSKSFGTTENLWNKYIFDNIKEFRGKKILEIAPGHGRITQFLSILASELLVVDLNETCIKKTKEKLEHHVLGYFVNNGNDLPQIRDNSQDLVFSFDSFVHIHKNVIDDYICEIYRVLKPGGKAFIHHSWLVGGQDNSFLNIAGRADMNPELFKSLVEKHKMKVVEQKTIKFEPLGEWDGTDSITIFEK